MENYQKALEIYKINYGDENMKVANTYNNMARILQEREMLEESIILYQDCLKIYKKTVGDSHTSVGNTYNNIGLVHSSQGNLEEALVAFDKSITIFKKNFGEDHSKVANSCSNIKTVLKRLFHTLILQGDLEKAMEWQCWSMEKHKLALGGEGHSVADTYSKYVPLLPEPLKIQNPTDLYSRELKMAKVYLERDCHEQLNDLLVIGGEPSTAAVEKTERLWREANAKFKIGEIEAARQLYSDALECIETGGKYGKEIKKSFPTLTFFYSQEIKNSLSNLYSSRSFCFFLDQMYAESLADIEKAIELDPTAEDCYIRKARVLMGLERTQETLDCLQQGSEALPHSKKISEELWMIQEGELSPAAVAKSERLKRQGNAEFSKGEIEAARQLYSDAIACIPPSGKYSTEIKSSLSKLFSNRAVTFFNDKMYTESLADFDTAIELDPTGEKAFIGKARALMALERIQDAFDCLQQGTKALPNSKRIAIELNMEWFERQARAKFKKGEIDGAHQLFSDALECVSAVVPSDDNNNYSKEMKKSVSMLYRNRAATYFHDKMYAESLADFDNSIELDPAAENGYIRKARVLMELERIQEAYDCLRQGSVSAQPYSEKIAQELSRSEFDGYNGTSSTKSEKSTTSSDASGKGTTNTMPPRDLFAGPSS